MRRMRTINEAYRAVMDKDSDSSITVNAIRTLCKDSKIHCVLIGKKYLLDVDELLKFFFG